MTSKIRLLASMYLLIVGLLLTSCGGDDNDPTVIEPPIASKNTDIQDFIWQGMNEIYYWQGSVPNLADNKFATQSAYKTFLESIDDPTDFFNSLIYQPGVIDRFSWIVDDYIELENSFQGISTTDGLKFGVAAYGAEGVFGFVRYILRGSDASNKAIKRPKMNKENKKTFTNSDLTDFKNSSSFSSTITTATVLPFEFLIGAKAESHIPNSSVYSGIMPPD